MTNTNQIQETLKRFRYLVGTLDQNLPQKFIVERKGNDLIYHARFTPDFEKPQHRKIAEIVGANRVIGGGMTGYQFERDNQNGILSFYDKSTTFGEIPDQVMEQFIDVLFDKYKSFVPNLRKIRIQTGYGNLENFVNYYLKPEANTQ